MVWWSAEEDARLRELLVRDRLSHSQAAAVLAREGFTVRTRNACIGRAARLGISDLVPKASPRTSGLPRPKPAAAKRMPGNKSRITINAPPLVVPSPFRPAAHKPLLSPPPVQVWGAVDILELREWHCRWPLWGHAERPSRATSLYCGAVVRAGSVYCPHHHGQAHPSAVLEDAA